jgi:polyisoprenoid-binding protein YceI
MRCLQAIRAALLVSGGVLLAANSTLADQTAGQSAPKYQPGDVHTEASRVYVRVEKTGLGHRHGVEARLDHCNLALGADHQAGQLVFDMSSFDADTAAARKYVGLEGTSDAATRSSVNANMRGPDVLNVGRFPTATFQVDSATATGRTGLAGLPTYRLNGDFTLHGKTRPLSVIVEVEQARGWLHLRGSFTLKQSSFGIKPYSKAFGAIGVADDLQVFGDVYVAPTQRVAISEIPPRQ